MGLNQPITVRGGPLQEDGGGMGGHHPGAQLGLGGAATRPAPKSSMGEEMTVCEPAEAGSTPGPSKQGPPSSQRAK